MKKFTLVMTMIAAITLFSCSSSKDSKPVKVDEHTSQNALDWAGNYNGTLMMNENTSVQVKLSGNNTYELVYSDEKTGPKSVIGKFDWNKDGSAITLNNTPNGNLTLKVGENKLIQNDANQLIKYFVDNQLTEQYWALREIMGVNVSTMGETGSEAYITFRQHLNTLEGSASCNRYFGGYTVPELGTLEFGGIGMTRMMCENNKVEDGFMHYLDKAKFYKVDEKTLEFRETKDGKVILKFENVKMK